jgi:hypothetical protein
MDNELDKLEVARDFYITKTGIECPPVENGEFLEWVKRFVRETADTSYPAELSAQALLQVLRGNFGAPLDYEMLLTVYKKRLARHDLTPSQRLAGYLAFLAQRPDLIGWRANLHAEYQTPDRTRDSLERVLLFLGIGGERMQSDSVEEFRAHCLRFCPIKPFLPTIRTTRGPDTACEFSLVYAVDQIQIKAGYTDAYAIGKSDRTLSLEIRCIRPLLREAVNRIDITGYQLLCEVLAEKWREKQFWFHRREGSSAIPAVVSLVESWTYDTKDMSE